MASSIPDRRSGPSTIVTVVFGPARDLRPLSPGTIVLFTCVAAGILRGFYRPLLPKAPHAFLAAPPVPREGRESTGTTPITNTSPTRFPMFVGSVRVSGVVVCGWRDPG